MCICLYLQSRLQIEKRGNFVLWEEMKKTSAIDKDFIKMKKLQFSKGKKLSFA